MDDTRTQQLETIRAYCAQHARAVIFDEPSGELFDVFAVRSIPLSLSELSRIDEKPNLETKEKYLILIYGDGHQVALTEVGIAFVPDLRNTGPLPDLPEVVCFRDYRSLLDRLKHELYGHADEAPTKATVQLLMMCLAIIDGARAQHFDVSREEREMEAHLVELEKRAPPKTSTPP